MKTAEKKKVELLETLAMLTEESFVVALTAGIVMLALLGISAITKSYNIIIHEATFEAAGSLACLTLAFALAAAVSIVFKSVIRRR